MSAALGYATRRSYLAAGGSAPAATMGRSGRTSSRDAGSGRMGRLIFGVPARFMGPRLIIYVCTFTLVAFGILMIYSASSVTAMADESIDYDAGYYALRQLRFAGVGAAIAVLLALSDYHLWSKRLLIPLWIGTVGLLALVFLATFGAGAYGATRWVTIAGFTLQPSEFAKVTVVLTGAHILALYFESDRVNARRFLELMAVGIGVPLAAILMQPDKGTTIICAATLLVMMFLAGIKKRWLLLATIGAVALALFLALRDEYSRQRVVTMFNPWVDEFGAGYQLIQGYYAFSSGGLFGVGIGLSRQKYSYLPMAHNDFIFAIIGEELGLVGTLGVLLVFGLLVWAGFQVARHAPDLRGRLVAAGCSAMIAIQLFVNVGGVLGIIPLSGKPVPFISYGGSSIISCLMLVGLIVSVSRRSELPQTVFDERRRDYEIATEPLAPSTALTPTSLSLVSDPTPRSQRVAAKPAKTPSGAPATVQPLRLTVLDGGRPPGGNAAPSPSDRSPEALRATRAFEEAHKEGRVTVDSKGRRRIDLGPDAASRLRGR